MPFIPVPDTVQLEIRGTLAGEQVENTFYYLSAGTIDQTLLDAITLAADTYVTAEIGQFSTNFVYRESYARDLSDSTFLSSLLPATGTPTGAFTGPRANNETFAFKRTSGFSGRSARGRIFWMGIADGMCASANLVDPAWSNPTVDWLEALDAVIALEGVTPVIVSRYNAGVPRTTGVTYPLLTWTYTDLRIDTLKGRLP